jgi:hypothetical protein
MSSGAIKALNLSPRAVAREVVDWVLIICIFVYAENAKNVAGKAFPLLPCL